MKDATHWTHYATRYRAVVESGRRSRAFFTTTRRTSVFVPRLLTYPASRDEYHRKGRP